MEQSKLHGISWKAYTVFLIVAMVPTTINIINPLARYVDTPFEVYTGESWSKLVTEQPEYAALYEMFCRSIANGVLTAILLGLIITLTAYRRGEKWAWLALVAGLAVYNVIEIVIGYITAGATGALEYVLWLCVGLVILLIPAKDFLSQKAETVTAS
jgi:hypothetical protein